jgi:hypothetical protein
MRIALYIQDGLEQVVLTPESDTEKALLGKLHDGSRELSVKRGSFYECRGGYIRQSANDDSTMIVLRPAPPPTALVDANEEM